MKMLLLGLVAELIVVSISMVTSNEKVFTYGTQSLAFGSIAIAAIVSRLLSDDIYRSTAFEDSPQRNRRLSIAGRLILFGIPSFAALIAYYIIK
jgi:hypothetical protein